MATTMIDDDGPDFADAVAKRDALLALVLSDGDRRRNSTARPIRQSDELTLNLDGWEGPLDLLLNLARGAEGRPRADLDPRAGRAISRLSRPGAGAEARDRRRLSRDGGVARLSQILPAAAQGSRGRIRAPRRSRCGCRCGCSGSTRCARRARGCSAATGSAATSSCAALRKGCGWSASRRGRCAISTCSRPTARSSARTQPAMHVVHARSVMTLEEALERVGRMIGTALDWTLLESFLPSTAGPAVPPLGAGLELRRGARAGPPRPARHSRRTSRSRRSS